MLTRRTFLNHTTRAGALATLGELGFLAQLPPVTATEARLDAKRVTFHPETEPLVRLLQETARDRVLEQVAGKIRAGLGYQELLTALLLAGVRNIQPRPVGFKFHAVLVVNSAHLASLASPDTDRWLPIFWAIDQFKSSQAANVREGNWHLGPVEESKLPASHNAKAALVEALENWDEPGADAAIAQLARTAGAHEIFEILCRYGARDFREIGHKEIYVANSFRTLEVIGWHHAEPVLRSLVYALLDRDGETRNPAQSDLPADRPYRRNLEQLKQVRGDWLEGKAEPGAIADFLQDIREGTPSDASAKTLKLLNAGVAPRTLFDACFISAGELLMRAPGILSLHAMTFTNAVHYAWQHCADDETRKLLLLQNAAFLPLFRGNSKDKQVRIEELQADPTAAPAGLDQVFAQVKGDRLGAARAAVTYLKHNPDPKPFADAARRLIFLKGTNSHDYKFSSAVLEDYQGMHPTWRDRYLASSLFYLRGSTEPDNDLVRRTRAALA
jgi:hypothetical protein